MVQNGAVTAARQGPPGGPAGTVVRRRVGLPSGRAVAGGLLVTLAALGIVAAYADARRPPSATWVVAARDLAPGTRLAAADLTVVRADLPPEVARNAFADPAPLTGAVLAGRVPRGGLLDAADLAPDDGAGPQHVSFAVEAARAVGGALRPGDRVDVVATWAGEGGGAWTEVVAAGVPVTDVGGSGTSPVGGRTVVVTLAPASQRDLLAIVHAVRAGNATLVRTGRTSAAGERWAPGAAP
jgi:Flp pilus assembly protein CpaB